MKRCFKCQRSLPLEEFYRHARMKDGTVNKCKACNKNDVRKNYVKNIAHYKEYEKQRFRDPKRKIYVVKQAKKHRSLNPQKSRSRLAIARAIRNGSVQRPSVCQKCGIKTRIEAHHLDYTKPLLVQWLCRPCHRKQHGQLNYGNA